jgi:hypothetical protein
MTAPHHSPPSAYASFELSDYAESLRWLLQKPHLIPPLLLNGIEQWYAACQNEMEARRQEPSCAS